MFPKAHAAAYVMSAIRIGWYKVHDPISFYAGFFSAAPSGFDGGKYTYFFGKNEIFNCGAEVERGDDGIAFAHLDRFIIGIERQQRNLLVVPRPVFVKAFLARVLLDGIRASGIGV